MGVEKTPVLRTAAFITPETIFRATPNDNEPFS
jgi:hypothetical protein